MKKVLCLVLCAVVLLVFACASASVSADGAQERTASVPFRLSGISDVTGADGERTYSVYAPYTDTYTLSSGNTTAFIAISKDGTVLSSGKNSIRLDLVEEEVYTLTIRTAKANAAFAVTARALNHLVTLPYDVAEPVDASGFSLESDGDPLTPAELNYQKRGGGTYIYSNNPEAIHAQFVGKALIRSDGLTGDVYVTFEHGNYSGMPVYMGYQLKNDGDSDVYVTVTNVGYQTVGSWLGQKAWCDFYNVAFALPEGYFTEMEEFWSAYAFEEYKPRVFQPITYRLPAGEYFYVIGGTSKDAYRHINVDGSADQLIRHVGCANGNVKFTVTGGSVTGTLYAYNDVAQVQAEPESLGYIVNENDWNYARQYSGRSDHAGVIDNYATWMFSDETADGDLPVTYTNYYDDNCPAETTPYTVYNSTPHTVNGNSWVTHLNPQRNHLAVGTDMAAFPYYDRSGNPLTLDNNCADGVGKPGNFGNWMIEYQDHFTFVNQGDDYREVTISMKDNGSLATLALDSMTGEILQADLTAGKAQATPSYRYTVVIPAHSVKQITLDYLLLANSNGNVQHTATLAHSDFVPEEPGTPDVPGSSDEPSMPEEPEEPETPKGILGDVDGSGEVDAPDYLLVKRAVLGTFALSEAQAALADVNGDGEVGAADYLLLKRAVLGTYVIGQP